MKKITTWEDSFQVKSNGKFPVKVKINRKLADTQTITVNPYIAPTPSFLIGHIVITDAATGNSYDRTPGPPPSWNNPPQVTPGNGNLQIAVTVWNSTPYAGNGAITITQDGGQPVTQTISAAPSGYATVTATFNMPSSATTITIGVTP